MLKKIYGAGIWIGGWFGLLWETGLALFQLRLDYFLLGIAFWAGATIIALALGFTPPELRRRRKGAPAPRQRQRARR